MISLTKQQLSQLKLDINDWAKELGFAQARVCDTDHSEHQENYQQWLDQNYHGTMGYLANNEHLRFNPTELHPGTCRIISLSMEYLPQLDGKQMLDEPNKGLISRYALGRDYHKLIRKRLAQLGKRIQQRFQDFDYRGFVDSAPVLERQIAEKAGLGWVGKNTLLINSKAGSYFFLAELFINAPLEIDPPLNTEHCGSCTSCLDICPTNAFVEPYVLDATKCISYLTIEYDGVIDESLRPLMGNRIYGCDDCQVFCPWTKFTNLTKEQDFLPRHNLDHLSLLELFSWSEEEFLEKTQGSPIRRTGFNNWQRNIAIAIGNAPASSSNVDALNKQLGLCNDVVDEHISWAIKVQTTQLEK